MILGCQALFGIERGEEIRAMVERVAGGPCPCLSDRQCPLMPDVLHETELADAG